MPFGGRREGLIGTICGHISVSSAQGCQGLGALIAAAGHVLRSVCSQLISPRFLVSSRGGGVDKETPIRYEGQLGRPRGRATPFRVVMETARCV